MGRGAEGSTVEVAVKFRTGAKEFNLGPVERGVKGASDKARFGGHSKRQHATKKSSVQQPTSGWLLQLKGRPYYWSRDGRWLKDINEAKRFRSEHEASSLSNQLHGAVVIPLEAVERSKRHHATKKSSTQLQREIDEVLATPAWAKGLDLSESRAVAQRLGTVDVEAKQRRIESARRASLPSLAITDVGEGIFVRVSSPGIGYGKYHAVVDALKAFQIPMGSAIPPNVFVPVPKAADKTKARTKVEEALRYAGYRV